MINKIALWLFFVLGLTIGGPVIAQVNCDKDGCELSPNISRAISVALHKYALEMPKVKNFRIFFKQSKKNIEITVLMVRSSADPVYGGSPGRWSITYIISNDGTSLLCEYYNR